MVEVLTLERHRDDGEPINKDDECIIRTEGQGHGRTVPRARAFCVLRSL